MHSVSRWVVLDSETALLISESIKTIMLALSMVVIASIIGVLTIESISPSRGSTSEADTTRKVDVNEWKQPTILGPIFTQIQPRQPIFLPWNNGKKTALFASFAKEPFFVFLNISRNR